MLKQTYKYSALLLALSFLSACASTQVAVSKRNLDVQTKMSESLFLDPVDNEEQKTIFIQAKNSSDKQEFRIQQDLEASLRAKGFRVVNQQAKAHFVLQVNVLQVGKADPNAAEAALYSGYGLDGVAAGGALAYVAGGSNKAIVGAGLLGGIAAVVADSFVKDVYYSVITDVQIREKTKGGQLVSVSGMHFNKSGTSGGSRTTYEEKSNWKTYQTRVLSSANKVNLEFEEALPELKRNLSQSIANIF